MSEPGVPLSLAPGQPWQHALLGDAATSALFAAPRQLEHLRRIECAWLEARASLDLVDADDARRVVRLMRHAPLDVAALAAGAERDGVVVPTLVAALRDAVPEPLAALVHTGLTSQDVVDTAALLSAREANALLDERIVSTLERIAALDTRFGAAPLLARTRMQVARPITVGARLRAWAAPLERHRERLAELEERLFVFGVGGADGTGRAVERGAAASAHVARALGLAPGEPRHAQRDAWVEYGAWLAALTGSLAKIGADVALMAQQGVDEVVLGTGGGSSAMPHKRNPVRAETLVAIARLASALGGALGGALVHEQERSGAAWTLEWMTLPPLQIAAASALGHATSLLSDVVRIGCADAGGARPG